MLGKLSFAASGLIGMVALAACGTTSVSPPPVDAQLPPADQALGPDAPVEIGLLLPLSGRAAALGQDMLKAAQMALFDVGPNNVVLLPRDTAGTPEGARQGAEQVIAEGASLILGPLFSEAVEAVTPIARREDVRVLAFSNVAAVAEPPTFILGFRPEEQVDRVVDYALGQGLTRIAGLAPDNAYGAVALEALQQAIIARGGELGATLFYPPDLADPSAVVQEIAGYQERRAALEREKARVATEPDAQARLRELETLDTFGPPPFDAILIADTGARLRSVAALLTFFDVDPGNARFLGTMSWQDDPQVLEEDALQGGWFASPSPTLMRAFDDRFERTFGRAPEQLAGLAYDATALAVIAVRDLGDRGFEIETLTNPEGFQGATGLFRLRPDGVAEHGLAVLEVGAGTAIPIDPAPDRFDQRLVTVPEQAPPMAPQTGEMRTVPGTMPPSAPAPATVPAPVTPGVEAVPGAVPPAAPEAPATF